jgi:hypothetical protein
MSTEIAVPHFGCRRVRNAPRRAHPHQHHPTRHLECGQRDAEDVQQPRADEPGGPLLDRQKRDIEAPGKGRRDFKVPDYSAR